MGRADRVIVGFESGARRRLVKRHMSRQAETPAERRARLLAISTRDRIGRHG